ncbi:unnamed protein product [Moneuplotes crassus]|uniref:Uncharacterized protein n=1 Tax=Euplotes crassus TaxID=5936 RepID=A0AAD2DB75_EUPCR|nr:unnamed protein product [Moneuplotes crassus]
MHLASFIISALYIEQFKMMFLDPSSVKKRKTNSKSPKRKGNSLEPYKFNEMHSRVGKWTVNQQEGISQANRSKPVISEEDSEIEELQVYKQMNEEAQRRKEMKKEKRRKLENMGEIDSEKSEDHLHAFDVLRDQPDWLNMRFKGLLFDHMKHISPKKKKLKKMNITCSNFVCKRLIRSIQDKKTKRKIVKNKKTKKIQHVEEKDLLPQTKRLSNRSKTRGRVEFAILDNINSPVEHREKNQSIKPPNLKFKKNPSAKDPDAKQDTLGVGHLFKVQRAKTINFKNLTRGITLMNKTPKENKITPRKQKAKKRDASNISHKHKAKPKIGPTRSRKHYLRDKIEERFRLQFMSSTKNQNFSYHNKSLTGEYHIIKPNCSNQTWLEIVNNEPDRDHLETTVQKFDKMYGRKNFTTTKTRETKRDFIEGYPRVSSASTSNRRIRNIDIEKYMPREENLFNISQDDVGAFYNPDKDYVLPKKDISVIKYENQMKNYNYKTAHKKAIVPEVNPEKVLRGFHQLGHVKKAHPGPCFNKQSSREVPKSYISARKIRSLCSSLMQSVDFGV